MNRMHDLAEFLKNHDDYCVLTHVYPDGDACGTAIALTRALAALGKRAFVYMPGGVPHIYAGFETGVCIAADADQFPFAPKTGFSVDVSVIDRMNGRSAFEACAHTAMLDHHATNAGFGDVYFVDGGAAACGELAVELMDALGAALDPIAATWLYIAIATDCGRFGYGSTRPETLIAAAACLRAGIDVDGITRSVFLTRTEGRTRLLGLVLSGLKRSEDGKICWARLTEDMLAKAGAVREDNEGIVNYLVEIEGVQAACLAEQRGAQTKISLRCRPPYDIARDVAMPLGGGGHANAAGVTTNASMDRALKIVLFQMRNMLNRAEECL